MSVNCKYPGGHRSLGCRGFFLFESCLLIALHWSWVANATINSGGFDFDSMPAVFGKRWYNNVEYEAQLKVIPKNAYLCDQDDYLMASSSYWNENAAVNYTKEIETRDNELPVALLVSRGACSFEEKARAAMAMNASFVIVYDDRSHNRLIPMSASYQDDIDVGMMFVSHDTGLELRHMTREASLNMTTRGSLFITMDDEFPYYYASDYEAGYIQEWILALMSVFFALLASVGCVLTCLQAGVFPTNGQHVFGSKRRMTKEQVLKLPVVNYGDGEKGTQQTSCPICLEEYEDGECLRQLPCCHEFHTECIIPWLERHSICPLCKAEVSPPSKKKSTQSNSWSYVSFHILSRSPRRTLVSNIDLDEESENQDIDETITL